MGIMYQCGDCGESLTLIAFDIKKGEPDHNGFALTRIKTEVREIVEHICNGGRVGTA